MRNIASRDSHKTIKGIVGTVESVVATLEGIVAMPKTVVVMLRGRERASEQASRWEGATNQIAVLDTWYVIAQGGSRYIAPFIYCGYSPFQRT